MLLIDTLSASVGGYELDAVVEQSSSNAVQSSTSGFIRAWSYVEQSVVGGGIMLSVTVKNQTSIDQSKSTMIVVPPSLVRVDASYHMFSAFADLLRSEL